MANFATKLAEAFAQKALEIYYQKSVAEVITNQDYEGEVKDKASVLNILTFGALSLKTYSGSNLTVDDVTESNGQLKTDQQKAFYFRIKSLARFQSWIKNPEGTLLDQVAKELKKTIDAYVLGLYTKVQAGNRVGTDYTTGTVAVDVAGAVIGSSTVFTAAMVGKGIKIVGLSKWYQIATYTDATHITIVDDLDDSGTGAYTGGVIGAGAAIIVEANLAIQVTTSNIYAQLVALKSKLDKAQIPSSDRFVVMPADINNLLLSNGLLTLSVDKAYSSVVENGVLGNVAGFNVYQNEQITGDSVNGYHVLAGHKSAITFAMGYVETGIEDLIGNFGKAYKGLNIYGAKVVDERRKALTELFCKL